MNFLEKRIFGDECVFNEVIERNDYNTYTSTKYSNDKRTFYLALNRTGQPKRVMLKARQQLGRMSSFTRVLTLPVMSEGSEGTHPVRHHAHMCSVLATESTAINRDEQFTNRQAKCSKKKKKKRKKKKKKCESCNNGNGDNGNINGTALAALPTAKRHNKNKVQKMNRLCKNKNSEECQRVAGVNKKKQKKFDGDNNRQQTVNSKKKKKNPKFAKNKKLRVITTELPSTVVVPFTTEESLLDEDYMVDNSTHWDWDAESSTTNPEESISTSTTTIVIHPD
ncbi:fibroblast growth factor [Holotrichia oblita]|uniref:Fibroblast growth factor n=1 Tax=Holotrichia oblita TaxID=644536 RepID=A0ACB9SRB8_HOLOL|nr:fibroblast growth factor [Holotrichia oblita]